MSRAALIALALLALAGCGQAADVSSGEQSTPTALAEVIVSPTSTSHPATATVSQPTRTPAPTPEPTATSAPTSGPPLPLAGEGRGEGIIGAGEGWGEGIVGYAAHVVQEGETLETIAADGGSDPQLIASYNLLSAPPQPGRELIVPLLAGNTTSYGDEVPLVISGNTQQPYVGLTFDAADHNAYTEQVLDTLAAYGARSTFFLTGDWLLNNPDLARRIVAEGHEIASHGGTHVFYTQISDELIVADLAKADAALQQVAGLSIRPFFRPPYGDYDARVLARSVEQGYLPIYWTLDALDTVGEPKSAAFIYERLTAALPPEQLRGSIILAHLGIAGTADALPAVLERYAELGLEVRPVSEVLGP